MKQTLIKIFLAVAGLQAWQVVASDESPVHEATAALEQGNYAAAIDGYESATAEGLVNGHLYYNLGIAYHRLGRIGDAMAAFLAARRYLPRDPDVAANLRFVLNTTKDKLDTEVRGDSAAPLQALTSKFTARELALVTSILLGISGCLVLLAMVIRGLAPFQRYAWYLAVAPLVAGALFTAKLTHEEVWGATFSKDPVKVYSGPAASSTVVFELQEGAPVLIEERGNAGFLRIQLSDGKGGWIAGSDVKVLGAPFGAM